MPTLPKNLNIKFSESPPKLINEALEEPLKFTLDELDDALPNIMEKGSPNVKEIFQEEAPKEKPTMDLTKNEDPSLSTNKETGEVNANFVYKEPVKLTKKGKPRKQMSEEQKQKARDNLKKARENKLAKKKALEDATAKLAKPVIKKVVEPEPEPEPASEAAEPVKQQVAQTPTQGKYLSKEDLESTTLNAILSYEKIRKERKAVKKEQQIIQAEKDKILNVARNHLHSSGWQSSAGRFNGCY